MGSRRKYELGRRAERQAETRRRIVEATAALHQEVGPAKTTISAIAKRAGVERLTVYRHFPEERELLRACQEHFLTSHPIPDPTPWSRIDDPPARLRSALVALYAYYRATEAMTANVLRDAPSLPALGDLLEGLPRYLTGVRDLLLRGWNVREGDRALLEAAAGHALDFETWRSLTRRQELTDDRAAEMMTRLVLCLAKPQGCRRSGRPRLRTNGQRVR